MPPLNLPDDWSAASQARIQHPHPMETSTFALPVLALAVVAEQDAEHHRFASFYRARGHMEGGLVGAVFAVGAGRPYSELEGVLVGATSGNASGGSHVGAVHPDEEVGALCAEGFDPDVGVVGGGGVVGAVPDVTFMEVVGVRIEDDSLEEAGPLLRVTDAFKAVSYTHLTLPTNSRV